MKKIIVALAVGFTSIQACSKQSAVCDCVDMSTEMMYGESQRNYDRTFREEYMEDEEHQIVSAKCEKLTSSITDEKNQEKLVVEMKKCKGYDAYNEELVKQSRHFEK